MGMSKGEDRDVKRWEVEMSKGGHVKRWKVEMSKGGDVKRIEMSKGGDVKKVGDGDVKRWRC